MTVTAELLRELHRIHRQLTDVRSRLKRGPKQIKAGEANVQRLKEELSHAKESSRRCEMTVREKELQLKEREQRIEDLKLKLNNCTNNREYQSIVEQIAADDQANSVLSDEILELLEKSKSNEAAIVEADGILEKGEADLAELKKRIEVERESLEADQTRLLKALAAAETSIPSDVRSDYDRIVKAHGEEALAPLEDECCGGCYQVVTPQMYNELRLSKLVTCKNCGRLLYLPEDTAVS